MSEELPPGVPPGSRKVPGLKLWADPRGELYGPMGAKLRPRRQAGRAVTAIAPMTDDGRQTSITCRKAVALAWLGPCPDGMVLRTLDGDMANTDPANLAWVPKKPREHRQHWPEWSDAVAAEAMADPGHPAHGARWMYGKGCRCRACTNAQRVNWHKRKIRKKIEEIKERVAGDA